LEPTGGYERSLLKELSFEQIRVSVINPYYVRNFAKSKKDLAKTDKIDSKVLFEYGEKMDPKIYQPKDEFRFELEDLTHRRDVFIDMVKDEKLRLEKNPEKVICESIMKHIEYLKNDIKVLEESIKKIIDENAMKESEVLQSESGIGAQTAAILIGLLPELGVLDANFQISRASSDGTR
jgi:transposase